MTNDEMAEMIAERNGNQRFCNHCDDCCQPYNSTDDCFKSAIQAMQWKDEQHAKEKQQWIEKAYKWCKERVFFPAAFDYDFDGFKKAMEDKL